MGAGGGTKFTIDRKIFESDIWHGPPLKLKIWIYLLGNANHKDGKWMGIPLKRGQLIRSYRTIQKACSYKIGYRVKKPSLSTICTICEEFTKELRIERRSEHGGQVITILNYNELQPMKKHEQNDEANDTRTIPERNKNVNNNTKKTYSVLFLKFWEKYPVKKEKKGAYKKWTVLEKQKELPPINKILDAIDAQKRWRANANPNEFIPKWKNPMTWLNKGCWDDEITEPEEIKKPKTTKAGDMRIYEN